MKLKTKTIANSGNGDISIHFEMMLDERWTGNGLVLAPKVLGLFKVFVVGLLL